VNPYAITAVKEEKKLDEAEENVKDVFFDKKKGKLIVKDNPVTLRDGRATKKGEGKVEEEAPMDRNKFLKMKRVQNVGKDKYEEHDSGDELNRGKKRKINEKDEKTVTRGKTKETHIVKFSGDEYKNKSGKGDKLVSGKYEPFAYIQLNPKTTSFKRRTDTVKLFQGIMHPEKKKK